MCYSKLLRDIETDTNLNLVDKLSDDSSVNIDDYCKYVENIHVNKTDYLSILHFNIRSLYRHLFELKIIAEHFKPDAILLCETFLHDNNVNKCNIPGYTMYTKNRSTGKGGGIAIYIKSCYQSEEITVDLPLIDCIENMHVKVNFNCSKLTNVILSEIYRVPNTNEEKFLDFFGQLKRAIENLTNNCIIGTDQNMDLLKINNKNVEKLFDIMYENELVPMITKPTRVTKSSATLIDQIYVSTNIYPKSQSEIILEDCSDHFPCLLKLPNRVKKIRESVTTKGRNMSDVNVAGLTTYLNNFHWQNLNMFDTETAFNEFMNVVTTGLDNYMPITEKKIKSDRVINEKWVTKGIMRANSKSQKLFVKWKRGECSEHTYKDYRNQLNTIKRNQKYQYFHTELQRNYGNVRKSWKVLNTLLGRESDKSSFPCVIESNKTKWTDVKDICNEFNSYFNSIGESCAKNIKKSHRTALSYMKNKPTSEFKFGKVSITQIKDIIVSLKPKQSAGHDDISNVLVKKVMNGLCMPLEILVNKSIETGTFPASLQIANVKPLYKGKGAKTLMTNYRPISLLPVFSKIFERAVYDQVYSYLQANDILNKHQFGFRPGHSCNDLILKFNTDMLNAMKKKFGLSIMCDLSKAFDSISRSTLFKKLEFYGIKHQALAWFHSYFGSRQQRVVAGHMQSELKPIDCGVGQGTILGPLVLIIMLNDLYSALKYCKVIGFADDTTIYHVYHNIVVLQARVKHDLRILIDWFMANKLSLNQNKTVFMFFSNNRVDAFDNIIVPNCEIKRESTTKLVGITIDEKLKFTQHVENIIHKCKMGTFNLKSLKRMVPKYVKIRIYYSFIYPHLQYCCESWGPCLSNTLVNKLQVLQNNCIRCIQNKGPKTSVKKCFKELGILTVCDIIKFNCCKIMYKIENNLGSECMSSLFMKKQHNYNTRNLNYGYNDKNIILETLLKHWNNISNSIKTCTSIDSFKTNLKKSLIAQYL